MLPRHNIENYRRAIRENVGKEISLYVKRGRKTIVINNCVIENAYEGIATGRYPSGMENVIKEYFASFN